MTYPCSYKRKQLLQNLLRLYSDPKIKEETIEHDRFLFDFDLLLSSGLHYLCSLFSYLFLSPHDFHLRPVSVLPLINITCVSLTCVEVHDVEFVFNNYYYTSKIWTYLQYTYTVHVCMCIYFRIRIEQGFWSNLTILLHKCIYLYNTTVPKLHKNPRLVGFFQSRTSKIYMMRISIFSPC